MGDEGFFGSGSVTWRVHVEPILWVAGLRAMYLQSLHPRVMRGTYQNSALFDTGKAWNRFLRTAQFVNVRTFGTKPEARRAAERVRTIHAKLRGFDPQTATAFRLDEPEYLQWVHCAEIGSYAEIAKRAGVFDDDDQVDRYIDENRNSAELVGLDRERVPDSAAQLEEYFASMRPRLQLTADALRAVLASFRPPMPRRIAALRLGVPFVTTLALNSLPAWARRMYAIPVLPGTDAVVTGQLRALRVATRAISPGPLDKRIADARQAAHEMASGTFRSALRA